VVDGRGTGEFGMHSMRSLDGPSATCPYHAQAVETEARNASSSVLPSAQKPGPAITTHCLCGINHLRFLPYPTRCTLWTGGNPPWSLAEIGFVPHFPCGSRIGVFWLCSALLAKWPVSGRDCCQVSGIQLKFRHLHKGFRTIGLRTIRETHLAEKALRMRLPIWRHRRNSQKKSSLQRHE
jgi:hypothetical protein